MQNEKKSKETLPDLLSTDQVAEYLGVTKQYVREEIRQKRLGAIAIGRRYRIPKVYLHEYLKANETK